MSRAILHDYYRSSAAYRVRIALPPTSNLFKVGHRIRLDIAGSNFPRFDVNPNTGESIGRHTHTLVAHNIVYLDRARPSQLILPIIPGSPGLAVRAPRYRVAPPVKMMHNRVRNRL